MCLSLCYLEGLVRCQVKVSFITVDTVLLGSKAFGEVKLCVHLVLPFGAWASLEAHAWSNKRTGGGTSSQVLASLWALPQLHCALRGPRPGALGDGSGVGRDSAAQKAKYKVHWSHCSLM